MVSPNSDSTSQENLPQFDLEKIRAQLKIWAERLLDLKRSNPLLGINRSRVSKLLVTSPDTASLFKKLVIDEESIKIPLIILKKKKGSRDELQIGIEEITNPEIEPEIIVHPGDIEFEGELRTQRRLIKRIYDNGRSTVEERGVTTLHLTFGLLNWDDPILGESSSPLLLVPCQLESFGPNNNMRLKLLDEEFHLNPALEFYLRKKHHIDLPHFTEDKEISLESYHSFFLQIKSRIKEQGWKVEDKACLSTFSFESLVIYNDLQTMIEEAQENPLIAALANARQISESSEALSENLDDLDTPNIVPIPVMTADASQLEALSLAKSGKHLIVKGPPGTGKSQTITNLIADAIGEGKKVLFVSAKMAALNVVHDRLSKLGLGRFCLEAHSTKAGKLKIIEELKKTIEIPLNGNETSLDEQMEKLKKLKIQLNSYVNEIHLKRNPLCKTIYQVIGLLEKLRNLPPLDFDLPWLDVIGVNDTELNEKVEALESLAVQSSIFDKKKMHPWRGFIVQEGQQTPTDLIKKNTEVIQKKFQDLKSNLNILSELIIPINNEFNFETVERLSDVLNSLQKTDELPKEWISKSNEELKNLENLFKQAHERSEQSIALQGELKKHTSRSANELCTLLNPLITQYSSWTRIFNPKFWKWKKDISEHFSSNINISISFLSTNFKIATTLQENITWFESNNEVLSKYVNEPIENPINLGKKIVQFAVANDLCLAISQNKIMRPGIEVLTVTADYHKCISSILEITSNEELKSAMSFVESNWENGFVDGIRIVDSYLSYFVNRARELLSSFHKMHEWIVLQTILHRCNKLGLSSLISALGSVGADEVVKFFEKKFYSRWVESYLNTIPTLLEFSGPLRNEKVSQFKELDKKLQVSMLKRIRQVAYEPTRNVMAAQDKYGNGGEVGILRKELQKKKRIKPLRRLFNEIPHVLQALKPCMLMSPISVSTFLKPGSIHFDLIVFDEASQLPTPEAIPAILRGKQIVVAGDENQLPPSTFFSASTIFEEESEEDVTEEYEPLESLLNNCLAIYPVFQEGKLLWHYRSKDERLIQFSNKYFYNNSLITFPASSTSKDHRGVKLVYTEKGVWDRGRSRTNLVEARKVAEIVIEHFKQFPERSLGVAAMNASQKEAIEIALDELISKEPELQALMDGNRPEPFFIKALENVQGDERDVIIVCIGYAKTSSGSLSLNFGPLNSEGGWRRLNVLVTRAKWQLYLVTSLRSHELGAVNTSNKGAIMLRNYIQYAEQDGELPADPVTNTNEETNDFEDSIATALRDRGLIVDEQVGASEYRIDLAIRDSRDKNRYIMAVECDGATYHHTKTARDRDVLRQEVLRSQGWKIYRVWSTDWFRDSAKELKGILLALEAAMASPSKDSVQAAPIKKDANLTEDINIREKIKEPISTRTRQHKPGRAYRKFSTNRHRWSNELMDSTKVTQLVNTITSIVYTETPIHVDFIMERLKEVYGVGRAGSNIQKNVDYATKRAIQWSSLKKRGKFIYKNESATNGFRVPYEDIIRDLAHIPPEEIENAILYLIEDQFGFSRELLPKAILEVFGIGSNRGEPLRLIESAVDRLLDEGRLKLNGYTLYLQ